MLIWYKLGAVAIVLFALWSYWSWSTNKIENLNTQVVALQLSNSAQANEIDALENNKEAQEIAITDLLETNQKRNEEITRYLAIFKRHDLNKLAEAKPGLIETRVNNGTESVFKELMNETTSNPTN